MTADHSESETGEKMVRVWLKSMGGNRALERVFMDGLKSLPGRIDELGQAIEKNTGKDIQFIAHNIKGAYGNLGVTDIYELASKIDMEAKKDNYRIEDIKDNFKKLLEVVKQIPDKYMNNNENKEEVPHQVAALNTGLKNRTDKSKILIVDDNKENRKLIATIIKRNTDHEILLASSGKAVLTFIEDYDPDLILLDIKMPDMDGFEVAEALKSNPVTKEIPILFITALRDTEYKIKAFNMGGIDFISKPFNIDELLARVNTHLQLKQVQNELKMKNRLLADRETHLIHLVEEKTRKITEQLYTDTLTKLPNRLRLIEDLKNSVSSTLILVNIDNFKQINNFFGNKMGDTIILELGNRLKTAVEGSECRLYKLHADEYAVLIDEKLELYELKKLVNSLHRSVENVPYTYRGQKIWVNVSFGVSGEKDNILETADMVLKQVKKKNLHYLIYNKSMDILTEYENNLKWARVVKDAVEEDRILPFFQLIVNNRNHIIEKYESLARLIDETGNVISPYYFLKVAKISKQYKYITRIILEKSFSTFHKAGFEFSINLSVEDILDRRTVDFITACLKEYGLNQKVVFEILESEGIESYDEVSKFISRVKNLGAAIAIDDFGAGYSNFAHILKLEVDYIKIDSSLIKNIEKDINSQIVVKTIVDFSSRLGIKTIAEFVDSRAIFEKVCELGVDFSQGYLISEPKPAIVDTGAGIQTFTQMTRQVT
ncbi:MAG TPA: EAL domain-containing protein [Spirochaetes bacterium]|nr:EAL domain-containing protein [Spirochaetota bacterium]